MERRRFYKANNTLFDEVLQTDIHISYCLSQSPPIG